MPQNLVTRVQGRQFDFLEPSRHPNFAREDHIHVPAAAPGTTVTYPIGQIVRQKDDGTNEFAKEGTGGYTGPARIVKHAFTVDENRHYQQGTSWRDGVLVSTHSRNAYFIGYFKTQDLVGLTEANFADGTIGKPVRGTYTAGEILIGT